MMKYFALAGFVILASVSAANATTYYCNGTTTETSYTPYGVTSGGTLPSGYAYGSANFQEPADGMDNGTTDTGSNAGMFTRGNHRSCGMIKGYLHTGAHPQSRIEGSIRLTPSIVDPSVVEAGCNVSLGMVGSGAYSTDQGYDAYEWPAGWTIQTTGSASNGHEMVVNWLAKKPALTGVNDLEPLAVYLIVFSCTTNVPPTQD